jgi:hypothetical protein
MVAASRIGLSNGLTYYVLTPLNEILKGMEKVNLIYCQSFRN